MIIVKQYHKAYFYSNFVQGKKDYKKDSKRRKMELLGLCLIGANTF